MELFPVLVCAVLAGVALEFASGELAPAGYFSLAAPVVLALPLIGGPEYLGLAVAVSGISSLGRLAAGARPRGTRLAGAGINVLRTLTVGGAMFGASNLPGPQGAGALAAAAAGYFTWLAFDQFLVDAVIRKTEDEESVHSWDEVLSESRAILALPPVAGAVAAQLLAPPISPFEVALGIFGIGMATSPFRGALMHTINGLRMEQQQQRLRDAGRQHHKLESRHEYLTKEKKRLDELINVYDLARNLGASTSPKETGKVVMTTIRRLRIPLRSCVVLIYRDGNLVPVFFDTPHADVLAVSCLLQLEEVIIQEVLEHRKPRRRSDLPPHPEERIFKHERSAMCVPLMVGTEMIGVLYVGSDKENAYTEEHFTHLKILAAFAAPSVETAKLLEDKETDLAKEREIRQAVEAKNKQLAGLQQMGQKMGHSLKSLDTITAVAESLKQMISAAQSVILFTKGPDDHALKAEYAHTPYSAYVNNLALRDDEGLLGKAIRSGRTILVRKTSLFGVQNLLGSENSVVVAPLFSGADSAELLGVLYVGSGEDNAFTEEHRNIVETVSYQTAIALKNARLYEQTQRLALTDGLTGLYTHRLFQEKLSEEIEWARRSNDPIVLVMVDADNFKTYNDTLGHQAGDALLIEIASLLRDKVRVTDIVCRYGGDEFALLLRNTTKVDARRMCERIREAFQLRFGGSEVQVTASIGLACFPVDATTKKDLAKAADDALYVSKRQGRNKVSISKTLQQRQAPPIVVEVLAR